MVFPLCPRGMRDPTHLNTCATDTVSSMAKMRCKHLPIDLKAAIKGGVNQTSKQWVPGGALPWLKTKHVLTQKSWTSSHFPISGFFFLSLGNFFLQQIGKKSQGYRRRNVPALAYSARDQQILAPGQCLWTLEHPMWRAPRPLLREPRWHHSSVRGPNMYQSIPGASPFTLHTGAEGLGVTTSLNPLLNSSEKPEQTQTKACKRARVPTPTYWIASWPLRSQGVWDTLAQTLQLYKQSKVWSHPHILFSCPNQRAAGRSHSSQKLQGTQEVSFKNFIFDKAAISKQGVRGQQGETDCQKNPVVLCLSALLDPDAKK